MRIIDLTWLMQKENNGVKTVEPYSVMLDMLGKQREAHCFQLRMRGTFGTYIDFPGHMVETEDGLDAANAPIEELCMLPATLIRLNMTGRDRAITAADLEATGVKFRGKVMIIHTLGEKMAIEYTRETVPYFTPSAIDWIIAQKPKIFVSDVYEKRPDFQGIFLRLFQQHIWTVCEPANLCQLRDTYNVCCITPLRLEGVKQAPCRMFAIEGMPPLT